MSIISFYIKNNLTVYAVETNTTEKYRSPTSIVLITLLDENDNNPTFTAETYHANVAQDAANGAVVTQVVATDPDSGSNGEIRYGIMFASENGKDKFSISTDGNITVSGRLDANTVGSYVVVVMAADQGTASRDTTAVVIIDVINVNTTKEGGNDTNTIIIAATICAVVLLAIVTVAVVFVRRKRAANEKHEGNHSSNMELENVRHDTEDEYQSLQISHRRTSNHTYQGLTARSENERAPEVTYEDLKLPSEFPRSQLDINEEIGQGEFGTVYRAEAWKISGNTGVTTVAVKELKGMTSPAALTAFFKELSILKLLGTHPNVVSFLGRCTETEPLYLLLEFVSGGSLLSNLRTSRTHQPYGNLHGGSKSLSSRDLTKFAWDVAKGMSFLAAKKIIHRDLATRNVLVTADRTCKVSDFGFSREGDEYESTTKTRLPIRWMALESLFHRKYTTKTDVWAFGVLLWEIVTLGATPYPGMSKREVMDGVQQGYRMGKPHHCDEEL
ncbi:tyrosine kinase receptor Cad96Ca-like [Branchiostoma floridae]|uniref:receptor protein-tyrosine kinase n=1 Tax=Branchiostoma floridae TaxID=7739 RepID=A0A9J7MF59_BRAFL|nr:tyrosine kinase receptor Cad96Ca-like [Branchiostoma floridae]